MYFKNLQKILTLTLIILFFSQFNVMLKDNFPVPNGFKNMLPMQCYQTILPGSDVINKFWHSTATLFRNKSL